MPVLHGVRDPSTNISTIPSGAFVRPTLFASQSGTANCSSSSPPPHATMLRRRFPDLDILESPLMSANPLGSILGTMPGSALAEKIFNDPESWEEEAGEPKDESDAAREAMAWLEDELEKYQALGDKLGLSPIERLDKGILPFPSLAPSAHAVDEKPAYLPIFERSGNKFLSLASPLPPPTSRYDGHDVSTKENFSGQPILRTNLPPPPLHLQLGEEKTLSPGVPQTGAGSASSTWSILELYGLNPDTPRSGRRPSSLGIPLPSTPPRPTLSLPHLPSSLPKMSTVPCLPSTSTQHQPCTRTPLPKLPIKAVSGSDTPGSIRKLPVIPDPCSLHPSLNVTPPNQTPERTPRSSVMTPSPPAGPRPRSGSSTPAHSRKKSIETPLPVPSFVICAPPVPPRPRRQLSPPSLRIGVH